jgi:hypothetical protein
VWPILAILRAPLEKNFSIFWTKPITNTKTHTKKKRKIYSHPDITIYTPIESPCRVDKKYAVLKNIYSETKKKSLCEKFFFCVDSSFFVYSHDRQHFVLIGNKFRATEKLLVSIAKWRLSYTTSYWTNVPLVVV